LHDAYFVAIARASIRLENPVGRVEKQNKIEKNAEKNDNYVVARASLPNND
jgi:hypothetical protein